MGVGDCLEFWWNKHDGWWPVTVLKDLSSKYKDFPFYFYCSFDGYFEPGCKTEYKRELPLADHAFGVTWRFRS